MADGSYTKDRTALLFVEPYNDFPSDGGKLWSLVEGVTREVGLHRRRWRTRAAIFEWIEGHHGRRCMHSTLGYCSSVGYDEWRKRG